MPTNVPTSTNKRSANMENNLQNPRVQSPSIPLIGTRRSTRLAKPSAKLQEYSGNRRLKQALGLFTTRLMRVSRMAENQYVAMKITMNEHVNSYQEKMMN